MGKKFEVDEAIGDRLAPGYRLIELRSDHPDLCCRDCQDREAVMVTDAEAGATTEELLQHRLLCQDCAEFRGLVEKGEGE